MTDRSATPDAPRDPGLPSSGGVVIGPIAPAGVEVVETRTDLVAASLFPEEEAVIASAVRRRQLEFITARACARLALVQLGEAPLSIPTGERGIPLWPVGVVGSITHCRRFRACAVARTDRFHAIGIDAEPNAPLPPGVLESIALEIERDHLLELSMRVPQVHWDRLLFSAKEAVYKAWYPAIRHELGFTDARIVFEPVSGDFAAQLAVPRVGAPAATFASLRGRWSASQGTVAALVAVPQTQAHDAREATGAHTEKQR